jgi:NAD(P)-dependent dehydrogenase (short-subunit alcohol dehydrogenase family)
MTSAAELETSEQYMAIARRWFTELDELAETGMVRVVEVDLAEPGGPARLFAAAGDQIDILVNNVGAAPARPGGFGGITEEDWLASLTLNLMAAVVFDALGVIPRSERARQQLHATGEMSHLRIPGARDQLTPQGTADRPDGRA